MGVKRYEKSEINSINKTGVYIRLSVEDYEDMDKNSIGNQREIIKKYAISHNLNLIKEYIDNGISGLSFKRENFQKLMNDVENNIINTIIFKDLSRFGRNHIEVSKKLKYLVYDKKIRIISVVDKIDTFENPNVIENIETSYRILMNEEYSRDISKKIKTAKRTLQMQGKYIKNLAPFGYKRDPNNKDKLIIDKEESKIVKLIFKLAKEEKSYNYIAKYLNENNIKRQKTRTKKIGDNSKYKWTPTRIKNIIENQEYTGCTVQHKYKINFSDRKPIKLPESEWIIVKNTHEPLVSVEDFNWIKEHRIVNGISINPSSHISLFFGYLFCDECEAPLEKFNYKKKDGRYGIYKCKNYCNDDLNHGFVSEENLKKETLNQINKFLTKIKKLLNDKSVDNILSINDSLRKEIGRHSKKIIKFNQSKSDLYIDWKNEKIDAKAFNNKLKQINEKIKLENDEIKNIKGKIDLNEDLIVGICKCKELLKKYKKIDELSREVLYDFVEKIFVNKKREIFMKFKVEKYINFDFKKA